MVVNLLTSFGLIFFLFLIVLIASNGPKRNWHASVMMKCNKVGWPKNNLFNIMLLTCSNLKNKISYNFHCVYFLIFLDSS